MAAAREYYVPYVHHLEGYSTLSMMQQECLKFTIPHIVTATGSLNQSRDIGSFVVIEYGAADGLNSVPMIAACAGELSSEVSKFKWIFNDLSDYEYENKANIRKVKDHLNKLPGWIEGSVKLQYVRGNFYNQVVPEKSVDLGVCANAVHWLSHRPPQGCNTDPHHPDEATKAISARDWVNFLNCRAHELKKGGRLVIQVFTTGENSQVMVRGQEIISVAPQQVIKDMFDEAIITKDEYEFARVFPFSSRAEADLRAPFLNPKSDLCPSLHLVNIKTYDVQCPFHQKWINAGKKKDISTLKELVFEYVNTVKSFYNSLWRILEVTRSREEHLAILEEFYHRVERMVQKNPTGYHAGSSVSLVDIIKE